MRTSTRIALAALAALLAGAGPALADAGTVLAVDGGDIYVDLGASKGVGDGSRLTLLHAVVATDPVSGETLRDLFPIGTLTVIKSGDQVSLAEAPAAILARVEVGDAVELASAPRTFVDPWLDHLERAQRRLARATAAEAPPDPRAEQLERRRQAEREVADAGAVRATLARTLGRPIAERIVLWQELLAAAADSPHAPAIRAEIDRLREQMQAEEKAAAVQTSPLERRSRQRAARLAALAPRVQLSATLAARPPARAYEGTAIPLAFVVLRPTEVHRALLYYKGAGDDGYQRVELTPGGDQYLRAAVPAAAVRPGELSWFVEVVPAAEAAPIAALGRQDAPRRIQVDAAVEEPAPVIDDRSRVTVLVDYVDFDGGGGDGFDQYYQSEIDFMYRFYRPIYAMRVGFGTMGGVGGPKDVIDDSEACVDEGGNFRCRRVTFSYAYTEVEYRYSQVIAFMLRPQFGFGASDRFPNSDVDRCFGPEVEGCEIFSSFGMRARVRLGAEKETNLTLGVGVTENVGTLFEAAFTWDVIPVFPIVLSAQVTDQPVPEDFGVRLIADLGWRALPWVYPSVRLSYQARDVDHAGLSGGVAANFDW